jgi:hypothetical protein
MLTQDLVVAGSLPNTTQAVQLRVQKFSRIQFHRCGQFMRGVVFSVAHHGAQVDPKIVGCLCPCASNHRILYAMLNKNGEMTHRPGGRLPRGNLGQHAPRDTHCAALRSRRGAVSAMLQASVAP